MKNNIKYIAVLALGLFACEPEFDNPIEESGTYSNGSADFSTFVAVGNSLTAGYMDGTVFKSGQQNSFPNIMAQQFAYAGGGAFTQPSFDDDVNDAGGFLLGGNPLPGFGTRLVLDASQGRPENLNVASTVELSNLQATAYNNMGVPGAKIFHLGFPGYGNIAGLPNANPYFIRHATTPDATVIGDAVSLNPTFFTLWIGNNDILGFATSGGVGVDQTGNPNVLSYGGADITDPGVFAFTYQALVDALTANGAKGVVATLPDVTSIPYFTTVPYNPVPLDAGTAAFVNNAYATYNGGLQFAAGNGLITAAEAAQRTITFAAGQNPVVIVDEDLTNLTGFGIPSYRMTTIDDLLILPSSGFIGTQADPNDPTSVNGVGIPLADNWVLTSTEVQMVRTARTAYNNAIVSIAAANDLAVADMATKLEELVSGLRTTDGQVYTNNYFDGSSNSISTVVFSLDGVHPNSRGYAIVADEFIRVVNEKYGSDVPAVTAGYYPGVTVVPSN
ncbi:G-D-S-L family lipolytic protein [Kordia sp. YSTF-M3]|uniref:G-D-S-L family lipolytic protein n=1 Tax=Kordia aestuariivivens TaxID=2759037 RepID=A0ABR7Q3K3_9FLAO|nr:G-D-S-L family lipolytic protein [Kordia aestuariivivens]MBC8753125.1 G-D-S-L family lipolytic protein [Kordia aestuariivivens]